MPDDPAVKLHNLKRKRTRERANPTRFSTLLDGFEDSTSLDDFEHYRGRLQETLSRLISLDDAIHDYKEDIETCEEYIDKTKPVIQKASRCMYNSLSASTARLSIHGSPKPTATVPTGSVTHSVKLPAIKLETFAGNVETSSRFWEQFRSSIDDNTSLLTINNHGFLRVYLEGEPKVLLNGIFVMRVCAKRLRKFCLPDVGTRAASFKPTWISSKAYPRKNLPSQTN